MLDRARLANAIDNAVYLDGSVTDPPYGMFVNQRTGEVLTTLEAATLIAEWYEALPSKSVTNSQEKTASGSTASRRRRKAGEPSR